MKTSRKERGLQIALITCFSLLLVCLFSLVGFLYYENYHEPAMMSVLSGCNIITEEEKQDSGFITAGSTNEVWNNETQQRDIEITVIPEIKGKVLLTVMRHEMCHTDQLQRRFLQPTKCDADHGKFRRYINEVECYFLQQFERKDINEEAIMGGDLSSVADILDQANLPSTIQ